MFIIEDYDGRMLKNHKISRIFPFQILDVPLASEFLRQVAIVHLLFYPILHDQLLEFFDPYLI